MELRNIAEQSASNATLVGLIEGHASQQLDRLAEASWLGRWRASLDGAIADCLLTGNMPLSVGARWFLFVFNSPLLNPHIKNAQVEITEVFSPDEVHISGKAVAGIVHGDLVDNWWGRASDLGTIGMGTYFHTGPMEALINAISQTGPECPAESLRNEARVQELLCETMDAWRSGSLFSIDGDEGLGGEVLGSDDRKRLALAKRTIELRFAEKLTINMLARCCGMGRARLIKGFKNLYGQTVADFLTEQRLRGAATALKSTRVPISQIAYQSGYLSNAAFTRAFARRYGVAPTAFRLVNV
jgi:AraC-like DNA-binding protein